MSPLVRLIVAELWQFRFNAVVYVCLAPTLGLALRHWHVELDYLRSIDTLAAFVVAFTAVAQFGKRAHGESGARLWLLIPISRRQLDKVALVATFLLGLCIFLGLLVVHATAGVPAPHPYLELTVFAGSFLGLLDGSGLIPHALTWVIAITCLLPMLMFGPWWPNAACMSVIGAATAWSFQRRFPRVEFTDAP